MPKPSKSWLRPTLAAILVLALLPLTGDTANASHVEPADEMFFHRADDGLFRYYDARPDGRLGSLLQTGDGYTEGWSSIDGIDVDGDGQDEMFFYRASDGSFRYYDVRPDGRLGATILSGDGYSEGWSSVVAVDLDGDRRDEMFFYRASDGSFRYYDVRPDGRLGSLLQTGDGYSEGWTSVVAVDLDGDRRDEMFFYRASDGSFRYYDVRDDGRLGSLLQTGDGYTEGWTSVVAVDLDGDRRDEMFFYRASDGSFRYYDVRDDGRLGSLLQTGDGYTEGWTSVVAVDLDPVRCDDPFTAARVADLERRYPAQTFTAFVYDTRTGCTFSMNPGARLRTASVFKVMVMAGTLLEAQEDGRSLTSWERSQLSPMIAESANGPVRTLWRQFGGSPWFNRQAQLFGMTSTRPVGDNTSESWGRTTTSAEDQVDLLRQVLLGEWGPLRPEYQAEAWDLMTSVVPSQTWGVTAGVPSGWTVAQKNGFAGHIANSVGFVRAPGSDEGYVVAVLSNGWSSWQLGVPAVEEIAGWLSAEFAH